MKYKREGECIRAETFLILSFKLLFLDERNSNKFVAIFNPTHSTT